MERGPTTFLYQKELLMRTGNEGWREGRNRGQTETVSSRFRPKFCFGFGVSVISIFGNSAKTLFWPRWAILAIKSGKVMFCSHFLLNNTFLAEIASFAEKMFWLKFLVWLKFWLFWGCFIWFWPFGQTSVSFDHYWRPWMSSSLGSCLPDSRVRIWP